MTTTNELATSVFNEGDEIAAGATEVVSIYTITHII